MVKPTDNTEKNIRAIYEHEKCERDKIPNSHKIAHAIADFVGTIMFGVLNAIFFAAWIVINLTFWPFDPYPFTLLITIVSLEAIFLSIIVLIAQNEMTAIADRRNNLDLQVNLLSEQEGTAQIKVLIEIARKLGVDEKKLDELKSMSVDTSPEDVLEQLAEVEKERDK